MNPDAGADANTNLHLRGGLAAGGPNNPTATRQTSVSRSRSKGGGGPSSAHPPKSSSASKPILRGPLQVDKIKPHSKTLGGAGGKGKGEEGGSEATTDAASRSGPGTWLLGGGRAQQRSLDELTSGGWYPARTRFDVRWPREEFGSDWYETLYSHLYGKVRGFVGEYFGYGDLSVSVASSCSSSSFFSSFFSSSSFLAGSEAGGGSGSGRDRDRGEKERKWCVWLDAGVEKRFLWFVEQVAIQDHNAGGWDVLLVKRRQRESLITGVVGKVLETGVFDDLLFGADKVQRTMLEAQDECTLQFEGYQRTNLRSQCVRTLLVGDFLTPEFWPCVDQLALQVTTLLLPLIRLMDQYFPASQEKSLRSVYQDMHDIVAEAAYLSLGIRWSRNVFRFSLPEPGEVWDLGQEHADEIVSEISEAMNARADRIAKAVWEEERRQKLNKQREKEARSTTPTLRDRGETVVTWALGQFEAAQRRVTGRGSEADPDNNKGSNKDVWRTPSRTSKVQIVVWPKLQRFEIAGGIDPTTGTAEGENITTILKSQVVYYSGRMGDPEEDSDYYPSLGDWVRQNKRERLRNFLLPLRWVAYAAGVWLLLSCIGRYISTIDDVLKTIGYGLVVIGRYVVRKAFLFVIEILVTAIAFIDGVVKTMMFFGYIVKDALVHVFGIPMRLLWGAGLGNATGGEPAPAVAYPKLSWASLKAVARALTVDVGRRRRR